MYLLKRKTTGGVLRVAVDQPQGDGDGGFQLGGVFYFASAGEDGDRHQMTEYTARTIMEDVSLAEHFDCDPPLPKPKAAADLGSTSKPTAGDKAKGKG